MPFFEFLVEPEVFGDVDHDRERFAISGESVEERREVIPREDGGFFTVLAGGAAVDDGNRLRCRCG